MVTFSLHAPLFHCHDSSLPIPCYIFDWGFDDFKLTNVNKIIHQDRDLYFIASILLLSIKSFVYAIQRDSAGCSEHSDVMMRIHVVVEHTSNNEKERIQSTQSYVFILLWNAAEGLISLPACPDHASAAPGKTRGR